MAMHAIASSPATAVAPSTANAMYPLQNDLMIRAAKGEKVERTPVWVFRQAGERIEGKRELRGLRLDGTPAGWV